MLINNDLSIKILQMDSNSANHIASVFRTELYDFVLTGYPLADSFVYGYVRCVNLIFEALSDNIDLRENAIREINTIDLHSYYNYSCKSKFNAGFSKGIEDFKALLDRKH